MKYHFLALVLSATLVVSGCTSAAPANSNQTAPPSPLATNKPVNPAAATTKYSLSDVAAHNSESDCWMVIDGAVYNVTTYIPNHPSPAIINGCGKDASEMFHAVPKHEGPRAQNTLPQLQIGVLSS